MPFSSDAQRKWMYANHPKMAKKWSKHTHGKLPKKVREDDDDAFGHEGFEVAEFSNNKDPFKLKEMPHLDADLDVKGKHLGTLDLRIERYPISPEEKKGLFQAFSRTGVVGEYNGELLHFKPDYTVDVIDKEAAADVPHLPADWEKYMMTVNEGNDGSIPDNDHLPDPKKEGEKYKKHAPSYAVQMEKDFVVNTIEGPAEAKEGDFLLKGEEGDMWPVDQEIFMKTYRPAETPKMEKVFKKK